MSTYASNPGNAAQLRRFKAILGVVLIALGLLGFTSLIMKEWRLALFGEHSMGIVRRVEKITTSTTSTSELRNGTRKVRHGSGLTFMYISFTPKDGKPVEVKTLATFRTEAKEGDTHPMIYLASHPENAKIYTAKQLWLPMIIGMVFSAACLYGGKKLLPAAARSGITIPPVR